MLDRRGWPRLAVGTAMLYLSSNTSGGDVDVPSHFGSLLPLLPGYTNCQSRLFAVADGRARQCNTVAGTCQERCRKNLQMLKLILQPGGCFSLLTSLDKLVGLPFL